MTTTNDETSATVKAKRLYAFTRFACKEVADPRAYSAVLAAAEARGEPLPPVTFRGRDVGVVWCVDEYQGHLYVRLFADEIQQDRAVVLACVGGHGRALLTAGGESVVRVDLTEPTPL